MTASNYTLYSQNCNEGYTYFSEFSANVNNINNESNCFFNDDIVVLIDIISINELDYSSPLEVGSQIWIGSRLHLLSAKYTQYGTNGINQQLMQLPDNFGQLTELRSLYLEWNNLTQLPDSFSQLSNLTILSISNNYLDSFPTYFSNLTNLTFLDLSNNQLTSIPGSIDNLENITHLWLFNNQLSSLPESICNLPLSWSGTDSNNTPYFIIGGNKLCNSELIPDCVENSDYLNISLDLLYYTFMSLSPQDCEDVELFTFYEGSTLDDFNINKIYPNPFNPTTNITYGLPKNRNVELSVYNIQGRQIETLVNTFKSAGYHSVNWNADNLPSGVYLIRMDSGDFTQTQKVLLVK